MESPRNLLDVHGRSAAAAVRYRGRFAPTPTGPLHFGSLVAAVGSFLQARSHDGVWFLRIDDLDTPRIVKEATDSILRDLDRLGLHWTGPVMYQSDYLDTYAAALKTLSRNDRTYPCGCSRKNIGGTPYPGTCRKGLAKGKKPRSIRVETASDPIEFVDALQGQFRQTLEDEIGDFVVMRADGIHAYHLAVVVDDARQGITEVVRGSDLLDSTPRQIYLQRCLNLETPDYVHLPVATTNAGEKLSKQTGARPISTEHPVALLRDVLEFLGQNPPVELSSATLEDFWVWAIAHWRLKDVPETLQLPVRL